ncbi:type I secretion system permease/ATPase [Ancylobacter terrae]|uniref:type I secretion system permease/ATPase n=1 Tax=Ancylobacter sp. sgz301288 TaxID=3342077 RepID=UPI00385C3E34
MSTRQRPAGAGSPGDLPARALASCRHAFLVVGAFSAVVNLLMLTGSVYMLQVYDRVLPSHSVPTLVALSLIVIALYGVQGLFDHLRQRILASVAVAMNQALSPAVARAILKGPLRGHEGVGPQLARDLDAVRSFLSGLGPTTLFDLPWMPLYLAACFLLHPLLGWTLVAGALVITAITLLTEWRTRGPVLAAGKAGARRMELLEAGRRNAEVVAALGMGDHLLARFAAAEHAHLSAQQQAAGIAGALGSLSRVLRLMLQSAMLGIGAWLVIEGEASPGVMIAASIMSSRALAPVELAITYWRPFLAARLGWGRLRAALAEEPVPPAVAPERPHRALTLSRVSVGAPGTRAAIVHNVGFTLEAGHGLGIIGPSASGKSTLARALVGVWPHLGGELRLDGATLDQWPEAVRGTMIGYLPQDVELFDGTVAENISRFAPDAPEAAVIAAAKAAGAYDMILHLPQGFATRIGEGGSVLSGGQRQRVALARALYGDPFLVVLDEPNASLDAEGDNALTAAIAGVRERGGVAVVVAHRPSALLATDLVLVLARGQVQGFGPKDEVLRQTLAGRDITSAAPLPAGGRPQVVAERAGEPRPSEGLRHG